MIIFALSAGTAISIGDLFLAGIGPGLLISVSLMLVIYLVSKRNGYGQLVLSAEEQQAEAKMMSWQGRWDAFRKAVLPLMMPVIILGGIYGGIFTPTEAAAVAVGYALVLGLFVYRTINQTKMMEILRSSVLSTSVIMLIIGNAGLLGWVLTAEKVPSLVANWFVSISDSPIVFLLLVNLLLLLVGMFLETGASIVIIAPILTPVAMQFGIDPIHFGIIIIVNLAVGMVTPPIGVNLFVACQIAGLRIEQIMKSMLPFYLILIIDILLVTYLPQITLWLPSILK
jgi:C4-dicarboxylate transporter DctM subunit